MKMVLENLSQVQLEIVKGNLGYFDKRADNDYHRFKKAAPFHAGRMGADRFEEELARLKALRYQTVLFEEEDGELWTYSGLATRLSSLLNCEVVSEVEYPDYGLIPWHKELPFDLYPYQEETVEKLLEAKHAAVSLSTGLGKTLIILSICKQIGLKTVVMAPTKNIAKQIYKLFKNHLGKKYVGFYGDGKHESEKLFVIGIAASLTRVDENHEHYEELSKTKVFVVDEAHTIACETYEKVALKVCGNAPYRFSVTGTLMRTDGLDIILEGVAGPVVKRMTVRDGVEGGYLSPLSFKMIQVPSYSAYKNDDINRMTRKHLYYNPEVLRRAASIANESVSQGKSTLILIEELEQFSHLLPYLKHEVTYCHGPVTAETKSKIPPEYHKSDVEQLVEDFNDQKSLLLIGTSCVSIGTDLKAASTVIFLQGGISEINVRQCVGRGTRLFPGKKNCLYFDFDVVNIQSTHRHASIRKEIYEDIYGPVKVIASNLDLET